MIIIGYASVFGIKDRDGDVILPQAFNWKFGGKIPLLLQHDNKQVFGEVVSIKVDAYGLLVKARLLGISDKGLQNLASKLFNGLSNLSIGYITRQSYYDKETKTRYIEKLDLIEVSIVYIGSNQNAKISRVIHKLSNFDKLFVEYANELRSETK